MKNYLLLLFAFFSLLPLWSQRYEAGVAGAAFSQAGPGESLFSGAAYGQSAGFFFSYIISENLSLRSGLQYGSIRGKESTVAGAYFRKRELSLSLLAEFQLMELNPLYNRFSPYLFFGSGLAYHQLSKQELPLWRSAGSSESARAEGGWRFYMPVGAGVKFLLGESAVLGFETGLQKTFSGEYPGGKRRLEAGRSIASPFAALRFSMLFGGGQRNEYLRAFYRHRQAGK